MRRARAQTRIDSDKPIIAGIINIKSEHPLGAIDAYGLT
jgi:hypothetical protein